MKLLSVNIGQPQEIEMNGRPVLTGIYKQPVFHRVWLGKFTLDGDGQADLTVHGGEHQAAYAYPIEHYAYWQAWLGRETLSHGTFGENFTTAGLLEEEVCVGDIIQIGGTVVQVTMPRLPCFKFAHKVGRPDILKEFLHSGYSGFYLRVLTEGEVGAGDGITIRERDPSGITVRMALGMQKLQEGDVAQLRRALAISSLAPLLRNDLEKRLAMVA
ncbi:MAG TPA: MOSC domain-containing protein [Chthoniobacter sp.]|jgi:MOSC domain-containing protein YiiM